MWQPMPTSSQSARGRQGSGRPWRSGRRNSDRISARSSVVCSNAVLNHHSTMPVRFWIRVRAWPTSALLALRLSNPSCTGISQSIHRLERLPGMRSTLTVPTLAQRPIDRSLVMIQRSNERLWEPENHRVRGEIARDAGQFPAALTAFQQAIKVAQDLSARSQELRAATSLARLWRDQRKRREGPGTPCLSVQLFYRRIRHTGPARRQSADRPVGVRQFISGGS